MSQKRTEILDDILALENLLLILSDSSNWNTHLMYGPYGSYYDVEWVGYEKDIKERASYLFDKVVEWKKDLLPLIPND